MVFIYVLELEGHKYYVGKTNHPDFRIEDHFNSEGCSWTRKYKPLKVFCMESDCDDYDENKFTLKFMTMFGIDNVRGGSFCQLKLSTDEYKLINKMISGATDKCYNCGRSGHFAAHCRQNVHKKFYKAKQRVSQIQRCYKCGRAGHYANSCLDLDSEQRCYKCDQVGHYANSCLDSDSDSDSEQSVQRCYKCGQAGHYANNCLDADTDSDSF